MENNYKGPIDSATLMSDDYAKRLIGKRQGLYDRPKNFIRPQLLEDKYSLEEEL